MNSNPPCAYVWEELSSDFVIYHSVIQQQRLTQLFSSTAEERYQLFLESYLHLLNRLSQVQIAAYLGITPEFLSRIRSRMAKGLHDPKRRKAYDKSSSD